MKPIGRRATLTPRTMEAPDAEPTIDRLRSQDATAFAWLVARTQPIVLGLGQSLGLRGPDLDDAAAEAFLAVYQALPSFAERSAITTWVYSIACRTLTRHRARRDRQRTASIESANPAAPRSADDVERGETRERIWAAVARLEPRSAMAVELHYRRGLSVDEVAAALSCPEGTVKTLLFRARGALRSQLESYRDER